MFSVCDSHSFKSPAQWSPLTSRIDLCQRLDYYNILVKYNCALEFAYKKLFLFFIYISSCDIKNQYYYLRWKYCSKLAIYCSVRTYYYIYPTDRMKTLIRLVRIMAITACLGTAKWIVLLNFLPKFNRYWNTCETLAEIERDCKEPQLNYVWEMCTSRHDVR